MSLDRLFNGMAGKIRSAELEIMCKPFTTYRHMSLNTEKAACNFVFRRPLVWMLMTGGFISITTTGRLSIPLLLDGILSWSFVPFIQLLIISLITLFLAGSTVKVRRLSIFSLLDIALGMCG